ncbi:MAG: CAP domain-containing protein [Firmicutes bacterium]|nr:CAP domain-containing protein [Bacillota bacterium]
MKRKMMGAVLSAMVVLGACGNAMAMEAGAAEREGSRWNVSGMRGFFSKYICAAGIWQPGSSGSVTIPGTQRPGSESGSESGETAGQETGQGSGAISGQVQSGTRQAQVVQLVNRERNAAGLESLASDSQLAAVAQKKAEDMAKNGYFSHTSPTYGSAFDMLKAAGISYRTAGENIAKGQKNAEAVMNGWMNSAGHRSNILSSSYSRIGVGYAEDKNGTPLWVQIFAG